MDTEVDCRAAEVVSREEEMEIEGITIGKDGSKDMHCSKTRGRRRVLAAHLERAVVIVVVAVGAVVVASTATVVVVAAKEEVERQQTKD